jgi:hypothetical protein
MAAKEHGSAYLFGVNGTYTNCLVQSVGVAKSDKLNSFVKDENGRDVASRHDDQQDVLDVELIPLASGFSQPDVAAIFAWNNTNYRVVTTGVNLQNTEHGRITIQVQKDEYLTLS